MPYTQEDVDRYRASILARQGARGMTFDNQSATFNSVEEDLKLLAVMEAEVAAAAGTRRRYRVATTSKGV
jgi:hypothetical protein